MDQVIMHATQLRSNTEYQRAGRVVRAMSAAAKSSPKPNTDELAALRLVIGTWQRIAVLAKGLDSAQQSQFFKTHPVSLMWQALEPAITSIRGSLDPNFAKD